MKIRSVLKSVQEFIPKLISRFSSIGKDAEFLDPGKSEPVKLRDSKDIAKARKNVKEAVYILLDTNYAQLQATDIKLVRDNNKDIIITPEKFEILVTRIYTEIRPMCETFITEKKMSPSICKYVSIVLSGMLIEILNEQD